MQTTVDHYPRARLVAEYLTTSLDHITLYCPDRIEYKRYEFNKTLSYQCFVRIACTRLDPQRTKRKSLKKIKRFSCLKNKNLIFTTENRHVNLNRETYKILLLARFLLLPSSGCTRWYEKMLKR